MRYPARGAPYEEESLRHVVVRAVRERVRLRGDAARGAEGKGTAAAGVGGAPVRDGRVVDRAEPVDPDHVCRFGKFGKRGERGRRRKGVGGRAHRAGNIRETGMILVGGVSSGVCAGGRRGAMSRP